MADRFGKRQVKGLVCPHLSEDWGRTSEGHTIMKTLFARLVSAHIGMDPGTHKTMLFCQHTDARTAYTRDTTALRSSILEKWIAVKISSRSNWQVMRNSSRSTGRSGKWQRMPHWRVFNKERTTKSSRSITGASKRRRLSGISAASLRRAWTHGNLGKHARPCGNSGAECRMALHVFFKGGTHELGRT